MGMTCEMFSIDFSLWWSLLVDKDRLFSWEWFNLSKTKWKSRTTRLSIWLQSNFDVIGCRYVPSTVRRVIWKKFVCLSVYIGVKRTWVLELTYSDQWWWKLGRTLGNRGQGVRIWVFLGSKVKKTWVLEVAYSRGNILRSFRDEFQDYDVQFNDRKLINFNQTMTST